MLLGSKMGDMVGPKLQRGGEAEGSAASIFIQTVQPLRQHVVAASAVRDREARGSCSAGLHQAI
jgi:hypothetical protein